MKFEYEVGTYSQEENGIFYPHLENFLDHKGSDGWELVSCFIIDAEKVKYRLIFKREEKPD